MANEYMWPRIVVTGGLRRFLIEPLHLLHKHATSAQAPALTENRVCWLVLASSHLQSVPPSPPPHTQGRQPPCPPPQGSPHPPHKAAPPPHQAATPTPPAHMPHLKSRMCSSYTLTSVQWRREGTRCSHHPGGCRAGLPMSTIRVRSPLAGGVCVWGGGPCQHSGGKRKGSMLSACWWWWGGGAGSVKGQKGVGWGAGMGAQMSGGREKGLE